MHILNRLVAFRVEPGTFPPASGPLGSVLSAHPHAHLFRLMPQLVALANLPAPSISLPVFRRGPLDTPLPSGIEGGRISRDEVLTPGGHADSHATVSKLARHCLELIAGDLTM